MRICIQPAYKNAHPKLHVNKLTMSTFQLQAEVQVRTYNEDPLHASKP
jgi:hypothetical protein